MPDEPAGPVNNLANALAQTRRYSAAVKHYRAAVELDPRAGHGSDQYNLGLVLGALEQSDEAIEAFEQAVEIKPDFPYPSALASNMFEMTNNHIYFADHLPRLTDIPQKSSNKKDIEKMLMYFVSKMLS